MSWWQYIPAAISAVGTIVSAGSANSQNSGQFSVNKYNATNSYNTAMSNIAAYGAIAKLNASSLLANAESQVVAQKYVDQFNVDAINYTTAYNDLLAEAELESVWKAYDLDLELLHMQRERERGSIEASQSASGVLMGQDSAAEVIIDQKSMEALDAFVIRYNADVRASEIANARAQSKWEAQMQVQKILWEGGINSDVALANAKNQALGIGLESMIRARADMTSAHNQFVSGLYDANMNYSSNQSQISNNFTTGMFGAGSQAVSAYYSTKKPETNSTLQTKTPTNRSVPYRSAPAYGSSGSAGSSLLD